MFCSVTPICSAIDMNRLLNTSSMTGSALVPIARGALAAATTRVEHEMVLRRDLGLPAGFDDDGLVRLDDEGGAGDLVAGRELVAGVDGGVVPFAARRRICVAAGRRGELACARSCVVLLAELGAAADRFDRHRFDDHRLVCGR